MLCCEILLCRYACQGMQISMHRSKVCMCEELLPQESRYLLLPSSVKATSASLYAFYLGKIKPLAERQEGFSQGSEVRMLRTHGTPGTFHSIVCLQYCERYKPWPCKGLGHHEVEQGVHGLEQRLGQVLLLLSWWRVVPAQRVAFFATPYVRPPTDPAVWVP